MTTLAISVVDHLDPDYTVIFVVNHLDPDYTVIFVVNYTDLASSTLGPLPLLV
jgi:hypothetical protein